MDAIAFHREVRNAISLSDELGRYEHAVGNNDLAAYLAAIIPPIDGPRIRIGSYCLAVCVAQRDGRGTRADEL